MTEITNIPMTVQSRHRLYTTERQRKQLGCENAFPRQYGSAGYGESARSYGHGTQLHVQIIVVDRDTSWDGTYSQSAQFTTRLGYYGEIYIPRRVTERLGLAEGDHCRVTLRTQST